MDIIHDYATLAQALYARINTACSDIAAGNAWVASLALMHVAAYMALGIAQDAGLEEEIGRYLAEETPGLIRRTLEQLSPDVAPPTPTNFMPVDTV